MDRNEVHKNMVTVSWYKVINEIKCPSYAVAIAEQLIKAGADVNERYNHGTTPLMMACMAKKFSICRFLMENGADVRVTQNSSGYTALHFIFIPLKRKGDCQHQQVIDTIKLLVKHGGHGFVNEVDKDGFTALHLAVKFGNLPVVRALLEIGDIDVTLRTEQGESVLHHTARRIGAKVENVEIANLILDRVGSAIVNYADKNGDTALHWAALYLNVPLVRTLLNEGAVPQRNRDGETPEDMARKHKPSRERDHCLQLLQQSINVDLQRAIKKGNISQVRACLAQMDCRKIDNVGWWQQIIFDCPSNADAIAELMIEAGVDVNATDPYGTTPLMNACDYRKFSLCRLLVEKGADVRAKDHYKWTALHSMGQVICNGEDHQVVDLIKLLVQRGGRGFVNEVDENGYTALHLAVDFGNLPALRALLDTEDVDVTVRTRHGCTVWHCFAEGVQRTATEAESVEIMNLLVDHGGSEIVNDVDNDGETALHWVAKDCFYDVYVVRTLLEAGAVQKPNSRGETPDTVCNFCSKR